MKNTYKLLDFANEFKIVIDKEVIKNSYFGKIYYNSRYYNYIRFTQISKDKESFIYVYIGPSIYTAFKINEFEAEFVSIKNLFLQHLGQEIVDISFKGHRIQIWQPEQGKFIAYAVELIATLRWNNETGKIELQ